MTIRIAYIDYGYDLDSEDFIFTRMFREKYEVILDNDNPDIIFFTLLGNEYRDNHLKYGCIRVEFLGENLRLNLNSFDYPMGCNHFEMEVDD